ncbi:MAG: GGDEF domain-containing protein [Planctomycetes bacterium]|nr:GGDEF domain-containing protein [Planctomycetota bacterium]
MDPYGGGPSLLSYTQFQHVLKAEFGRARRYGVPLACVVLAIDRLDALRDAGGVVARDQVLARIIGRLQGQVRGCDVLAHWGDRLVALLPQTAVEGACAVAERFRSVVASESFTFEGTARRLTASAGVAVVESKSTLFFDSLPKAAESAAQQAVAAGGDRSVIAAGNC